jgi:hypothetical protein
MSLCFVFLESLLLACIPSSDRSISPFLSIGRASFSFRPLYLFPTPLSPSPSLVRFPSIHPYFELSLISCFKSPNTLTESKQAVASLSFWNCSRQQAGAGKRVMVVRGKKSGTIESFGARMIAKGNKERAKSREGSEMKEESR